MGNDQMNLSFDLYVYAPFQPLSFWGRSRALVNKQAMADICCRFQVVVLFVSVLLVNYLIADGKSHWLEGMLLMWYVDGPPPILTKMS